MVWINLTQDRDGWQAFVNAVMLVKVILVCLSVAEQMEYE